MQFSISTNWNSRQASSVTEIADQVSDLGLDTVELGYAITSDQADELRKLVDSKQLRVSSVHNYCPVPPGASIGHPEHFLFGAESAEERRRAVQQTLHTLALASDVGAGAIVAHAARVRMRRLTPKLIELAENGKQGSRTWCRTYQKTLQRRDKRADIHMGYLRESLDALLPHFQEAGIALALENLPSWDAMPSETEMLTLCSEYDTPALRYWHDIGHGQVRANLGFIHHQHWVEKLLPYTAGTHVHDCAPPADDHLMPPLGRVNFSHLKSFAAPGIIRVLEPAPGTPAEAIRTGLALIREAWSTTNDTTGKDA